jgi:hypothetical protein
MEENTYVLAGNNDATYATDGDASYLQFRG